MIGVAVLIGLPVTGRLGLCVPGGRVKLGAERWTTLWRGAGVGDSLVVQATRFPADPGL